MAHETALMLPCTGCGVSKPSTPVNDLTTDQWRETLAEAGGRCAYCGEDRKLTQDHVIPLSRGGSHTASNVVAACGPCNYSKGTKLVEEWLSL